MTKETTPPQVEGMKALEQELEKIANGLRDLVTEKHAETDASLREELGKEIEGVKELKAKVEHALEEAKGSFVPGLEIGTDKGQFSFHRLLKGIAHESIKGVRDVWGKKEFGVEGDYLNEVRERVMSGKAHSYTGATDPAGAYLILTDVQNGILELFRSMSVAYSRGVRPLYGLSSNLAMTRNTGGTQFYWVDSEAEESLTESESQFTSIQARPHPGGCFSKLTWGMLNQPAESMEQFVREEHAEVLALAEDQAILNGTGASSQPQGIFNVSGVQTQNLGASADTTWGLTTPTAAKTAAHRAYTRGFPQALRSANALGRGNAKLGWIMETEVAEDFESAHEVDHSVPTFLDREQALLDGPGGKGLMRYPVSVTTNVTGTASDRKLLFGDFNQCLVPHWGAMEFRVLEEGDDAKKLRVTLRTIVALDVAVLQPTAFVKATNYQD